MKKKARVESFLTIKKHYNIHCHKNPQQPMVHKRLAHIDKNRDNEKRCRLGLLYKEIIVIIIIYIYL